MAELAAIAGCDFIRVDMEHNLFTVEQVQHIVRAADGCGIATCIRLDEYSMITPMLDFGVEGFMFPHVRSAAQAKDLVERVKYAPTGRRGYADAGRAQRYGSMPFSDYMKEAQFDVFLQVQIEDREGLEHMEEIIATPGLDFICTGRGDIAQALGIPGYGNDAKVTEVENRIIDCASKHGLRCQLSVGASVEKAREFYKRGVRTFTIGDDRAYLLGALKENVDMFRAVMFKQ
jgi:4-hydroxy-2-oxoheptanedioate aldolase